VLLRLSGGLARRDEVAEAGETLEGLGPALPDATAKSVISTSPRVMIDAFVFSP
jgi:hypothetical protein